MPDIWALMRAIRGSSLSAPEKHVLLTLTSLIDPSTGLIPERFQPSLTDLTRYTGLGRSTIARSLNSTEESGWVKRTVPTKYASQKNKEKTSYLLVIPAEEPVEGPAQASPTVGLVPERDQPESWSQGGTSATAGLGLVPQRDQVSPTVGLKELNLCTKVNQPPPTEGAAPATTDLFGEPVGAEAKPRTKKQPAKPPRMSRTTTKENEPLPLEWAISQEMTDWAKKHAPNVILSIATQRFLVHWGDTGRKKDWDKTWRNWILGDEQRFQERTRNGANTPPPVNGSYQSRRGGSTYVRMTNSHSPDRDYSENY